MLVEDAAVSHAMTISILSRSWSKSFKASCALIQQNFMCLEIQTEACSSTTLLLRSQSSSSTTLSLQVNLWLVLLILEPLPKKAISSLSTAEVTQQSHLKEVSMAATNGCQSQSTIHSTSLVLSKDATCPVGNVLLHHMITIRADKGTLSALSIPEDVVAELCSACMTAIMISFLTICLS